MRGLSRPMLSACAARLGATFAAGLLLAAPSGADAQVVLSELMYDPIGGNTNEFVELHNVGTNAVDIGGWHFSAGITYTFAAPCVLEADAYLVVAVNRAAFGLLYPNVTNLAAGAYTGQLSNQGEQVALADAGGAPVFSVTYNNKAPWPLAAAGLGSSLVLVDPASSPNNPSNWVASAQLNGSPGGPDTFFLRDVVINEVLAHTDPPYEDAVELRNLTAHAIDLSGWYLSDDNATRKKYRFPAGSVIPAGGYFTVYQYQMAAGLVPFALSAKGDDLYVSEADASDQLVRYVDQYQYGASQNGFSFGRYPDGTGDFMTLSAPTFGVSGPASVDDFRTGTGARNAGPKVGPVVINEIMYHPSETNALGRMPAEYIELLNVSAQAVPLYNDSEPTNTWTLSGGISYSFPTNLVLQPGQLLLVAGTNDLAGFRASYGVPDEVPILGPWSKSLGNAGDTVRLRVPNTVEVDGTLGRYVVDEVTYGDQLPWPLAADGLGGALERTDPSAYGNTAANWHSAPDIATPGTTNTVYVAPGAVIISEIMAANRSTLRDEDGEFSDWIELYNTTGYAISLKGWHLTDQPGNPTLWTFPDVSIPAYGQLIVFASSKDRAVVGSELHANFSLDAGGEYLALFRNDLVVADAFDPVFPPQDYDVSYGISRTGSQTATPILYGSAGRYLVPTNSAMLAADWASRTFDDSAWKPAGNGIGFDTDTTSSTSYVPLFQTDLYAEMYGKQKSAFVRYPFVVSNSAAVAQLALRVKFDDGFAAWINGVLVATNNTPVPLAWNSGAPAGRSDSLAIVFTNFNLSAYAYLLTEGTNVLALQSLNNSSTSTDLILQNELQLTWAAATDGVARAYGFLGTPTPGNLNGDTLPGVVATPTLSPAGGVFAGSVTVTAACANAGAEIRYTLDGSTPTTNSARYTGPITLTGETEVLVRTFLPGQVPSPVAGELYRLSFLGINELLAFNVASTPEIHDFTDFGDWIELYNGGTNAVDLGGYYLSDNLEQPFRWQIPAGASIPAKGHLLVWADGYDSKPGLSLVRDFWPYYSFVTRAYHANFKLSSTGEEVGLFTAHGSRVDGVVYGPDMTDRWYGEKAVDAQQGDISFGRYPDGSATWGFFGEPTAGTTNRLPQLTHNLYRAPATVVSPAESLFVASPVTVALSSGAGVREIRYTLDGSQPNSSSTLYTNAFVLTTNTVVRARSFADGVHPGPVVTRTFVMDQRRPDLPIVSVAIDPLLLFDPIYGIYTNVLKERDVPGSVQFCTTPSNTAFQANAAFRLFSLNTFLKAQKPFTVKCSGKYGNDSISYKLFPEKPLGNFDRFVLRNGNDDWAVAFLRDTLGQQMLKGAINNATQGFRPCASYLNGAYYGLINIQEKMDEVYCARNYGVDLANIDFFENDGTTGEELLDYGTADGWNALLAFLGANSLAVPANYEYVKSQVDIEDLVDYVAGQLFADDTAWAHNRKWWRDRNPGGKWRWCFVDLDRAFGTVTDNRLPTMASSMVVFHELLANSEFKDYCAQRLMAHLNSSFSTNRIIPIIDYEAGRIRSEIIEHSKLYASKSGISSVTAWDANIEAIRNYARQRPALAMQQVANYFAGGQTAQILLGQSGEGQTLANHVPLLKASTNTLLAGTPVTFTAVPAIGKSFAYWVVSNGVTSLSNKGSTWRYLVPTNSVANWNQLAFDDSSWASGAGQLGYGDGDEATVIGAASNLITAAYFRRAFVVTDKDSIVSLDLQLLRDDGAIVYLNGNEILRTNMSTGAVTYATFALTNITSTSTPDENAYLSFTVPSPVFVNGTNVLAVELHQSSVNYTDFGFDMQATATRATSGVTTNTSSVLTLTPDSSTPLSVTAVYTSSGASLLPATVSGSLTLTAAGSPWLAAGDVYVPSNTSLTAEPGATILMPEKASIYVQGRLCLAGTPTDPVNIGPNTNLSAKARLYTDPALADATDLPDRWGGLSFDRADHPGVLSNVVIRSATFPAAEPVKMIAAVSSSRTDMTLHGLDVDDSQLPLIAWDSDWYTLEKSRLHITVIGDALKITRVNHTRIHDCDMYCGLDIIDTDAIDFGDMPGDCIVWHNHFHDFTGPNNDGLDLGEDSESILLVSNLIERCSDKGVSCGASSTLIARHNVIRDVDMGFGFKDLGSHGVIENNTFYDCTHAVSAYEKVIGRGGASAVVRNCIVSKATVSPFYHDPYSSVEVSYSLSDTDPVEGAGNVVGDPLFLNEKGDTFELQTGSPAIDAGDPAEALDPDGTRADIGAEPFDWRKGHAVISEIFYHPADPGLAEYVELTNPGRSPLDLSGYSFGKGFTFTFPEGTLLNPSAYLVVAAGLNTPGGAPAQIWSSGSLDNAGETIQLLDPASNEIDRVSYEPKAPWPAEADGTGASLVLIHPRWNNALPSSWKASAATGGTPGGPELTARNTPVWWLAQYGATNNFGSADDADPDGDGMPNWREFVAGTQPTNAASSFVIELEAQPNGGPMAFCRTVAAGPECNGKQRYYTFERRTNLVNDAWTPVPGYTDILGAGQVISYTNAPTGTGFLRVKADLR